MFTVDDLKSGHVYEAKHPRKCGGLFDPLWNDRQIRWVDSKEVCYDSPTVKPGADYPIVPIEKFLKWAGRDITNEMPKGEWRSAK